MKSRTRVGLLGDLLRIARPLADDQVVTPGINDILHGVVLVTGTNEEQR
jgi:hypothetical protein